MSLITTLIEGMTSRFVEGRWPTGHQAPGEAPPMSPPGELKLLEEQALERGISSDELTRTQRIGNCPAQVQERIKHLHEWLATH